MWTKAIEDAIRKTRNNLLKYGDEFPHITEGNGDSRYKWGENTDWFEGFYTGMTWLSYQYSGDSFFQEAGRRQVESFRKRLQDQVVVDHHDIGFLYSPSAMAQWFIEKDPSAKELALAAADQLMRRWRPKGQYIQAWGNEGDEANGGRIIIDCLMNLPLLYWAYQETGKESYRDVAVIHTEKSRRFLVRGDDSSYHTFYFDPETGDAIRGGTHQGYRDGSTWTRGQAWGIYGFALSYRYTKNPLYLETSKRLARYFIEHLPEDSVAYWDFNAPVEEGTARDSSASSIAACGMLELIGHMDADDPERQVLQAAVERSMTSLMERYGTMDKPDAEGLLEHGSYHVWKRKGPDDFIIWGDYFYLEALMRLERGFTGYWYE